ncbi:MAG: hypothetical protein COB37_00865 [Kordiimonadales bacterium]|nr:MAG: hypothetical protein COB37_00865 [Kordiimonadales bacterium]
MTKKNLLIIGLLFAVGGGVVGFSFLNWFGAEVTEGFFAILRPVATVLVVGLVIWALAARRREEER